MTSAQVIGFFVSGCASIAQMQAVSIERNAHSVIAAEKARCVALESEDYASLRRLISPDITHTHTRGVTDNYDSYFRYLEQELEFLECRRGELLIRLVGDLAIMTGTLHSIVRKRGTETRISVDSQVLQVWDAHEDGRWLLRAFQATSLPK